MGGHVSGKSSRAGRWLAREDGWAGTPIMAVGLVMLLLVAIQAFLWYAGWNVAQSAAQSAYSVARAHDASAGSGESMAYGFLNSMGGSLQNPDVAVARGVESVSVTVSGNVLSIFPGLSLPRVSATVEGPVERWVPAP